MNTQNKRERLVDSAAVLFHRNGLSSTSLADIAKHADIPIGNVYYYFKTKEELALAAIQKRKEQFSAGYNLIAENVPDPRQRLIEALGYFYKVREEYAHYGCPIGKIIADVDPAKDTVGQIAADIFADFTQWARKQFEQLGHTAEAESYAVSLMAGIQGATVMAKAARKADIISDEITRLHHWIESLPNKRIHLGKVGFKATDDAA